MQCTSCTGGNTRASVGLYDSAGNLVSNSTVTTTSSTYTRVRSASITLTTGTDYTIRLARDATGGTAYVEAARIIIIQSDSDHITNTESQFEIGEVKTTTTSGYVLTENPQKQFIYVSTAYSPAPTIYFEATLANDTAGQTAYAALYEAGAGSCVTAVASSEVSVTGTSWSRVRSGAITLTNGNNYLVCIRTSTDTTTTAKIANAKIVLVQSDATGITKTEIFHTYNSSDVTNTGTTYASLGFPNQFDPANFNGGSFDFHIQAAVTLSAGTGYIQLYNSTDASAFTETEQTGGYVNDVQLVYGPVQGTAFAYQIDYTLPTSAKNLDIQIKNSGAGNDTSVDGASLVIWVSNLQVPEHSILFVPLGLFIPVLIKRKKIKDLLIQKMYVQNRL